MKQNFDNDDVFDGWAIVKVQKISHNKRNNDEPSRYANFKVPCDTIIETMKFLNEALNELKINDCVVYLSGYERIRSNNSMPTKKEMIETLRLEFIFNGKLPEENVSFTK